MLDFHHRLSPSTFSSLLSTLSKLRMKDRKTKTPILLPSRGIKVSKGMDLVTYHRLIDWLVGWFCDLLVRKWGWLSGICCDAQKIWLTGQWAGLEAGNRLARARATGIPQAWCRGGYKAKALCLWAQQASSPEQSGLWSQAGRLQGDVSQSVGYGWPERKPIDLAANGWPGARKDGIWGVLGRGLTRSNLPMALAIPSHS